MRVCHISNYDVLGGASRSAYRLHRSLVAAGVESRMLVGRMVSGDSTVSQLPSGSRTVHWLEWRVSRLLQCAGAGDLWLPACRRTLRHPWLQNVDVVHLHKTHGGHLSLSAVSRIARRYPIVWTLHDMWALTGFCYQSLGCERWKVGCGRCPQVRYPEAMPIPLQDPPMLDATTLAWSIKCRAYAQMRLTVACPSTWLTSLARESPLLRHASIIHVPYGIDTAAFRPIGKKAARHELGLPPDGPIVLFITGKGEQLFARSLAMLDGNVRQRMQVLVVGDAAKCRAMLGAFRPAFVGTIGEDEALIRHYCAADVYVLATYADNLPNTVIESSACGTPVVATDVGGVRDVVRHGDTGYLAAADDPAQLAAGMAWVLEDPTRREQLGRQARALAVSHYDSDVQAHRYAALYRQMLDARAAAPESVGRPHG